MADWTISQCFGEKVAAGELMDADVLSAVEFDGTGRYLATGDKGGRVVVFEYEGGQPIVLASSDQAGNNSGNGRRSIGGGGGGSHNKDDYKSNSNDGMDSSRSSTSSASTAMSRTVSAGSTGEFSANIPGGDGNNGSLTDLMSTADGVVLDGMHNVNALKQSGQPPMAPGQPVSTSPRTVDFRFFCEFQSHEPEFDYLKSLEIEEKINKIRWCRPSNNALFLLSTNDKTIKLWKVFEKQMTLVSETNLEHKQGEEPGSARGQIRVPKLLRGDVRISSQPRRTFANAHAYHINSISANSDGETYMSADDLRINLWNLAISDQTYNIVDIKPANMEELTEVITAAEFHPSHCNLFMYSSSRGNVKLGDMRSRALCDNHSKLFQEAELPTANKSFFSEIIASVSDVKFSKDGRYIFSRDFLTLKVWDINMESKPVKTIHIHEHLRGKLCDLYENDCIFDKFECCVNGSGTQVMTGSYNNLFHVYDLDGDNDACIEASQSAPRHHIKQVTSASADENGGDGVSEGGEGVGGGGNMPDTLDYDNKILHLAWHPHEDTLAIAGLNNLFMYSR